MTKREEYEHWCGLLRDCMAGAISVEDWMVLCAERPRGWLEGGVNLKRHWIYFMLAELPEGVAVKIGLSDNPERRRAQIQAANPGEIELTFCYWGHAFEEKQLHDRFKDNHLHGEWFSLTDELTDYVRRLRWYCPDYEWEQEDLAA